MRPLDVEALFGGGVPRWSYDLKRLKQHETEVGRQGAHFPCWGCPDRLSRGKQDGVRQHHAIPQASSDLVGACCIRDALDKPFAQVAYLCGGNTEVL